MKGEGLWARVLRSGPGVVFDHAPEICIVCLSMLRFLTSESSWWNDLGSLTVPRSVPLGPVLFADPGSSGTRGLGMVRPQSGGEARCRCVSFHASVPSLMGWCPQQASLCGKKFPSNYTAVLWWLRAIMGKLCSQSTLIHKFHSLIFFSLFERSVFCGSFYHSHASKCE